MIKFLHIFGTVLFIGNIIVSALWRIRAEKTRDASVINHALRTSLFTDWIFTLPGAILIGVTGHMLAPKFGGIAGQPWIYHGYALLTVSVLIILAVLVPLRLKQIRMQAADPETHTGAQFAKLSLWWTILGLLAAILALVALYLMSVKPV